MADKEINPFKEQDITLIELPANDNTRFGSQIVQDMRAIQVGIGSKVFRADESGIWLGSSTFATAPFSVDMEGNVTASSIVLGGYVPVGGSVGDVQTTIGAGGLSAISANIGTITAGSITGVTITGGLFRTATTGRRIEISSATANKIEFYDSTTLYGTMQADKVGSDGYITFLTQDGTAGIELYTGIGASAYGSVYMFGQGGNIEISGNASNSFVNLGALNGGSFTIHGGATGDEITTDIPFSCDLIPSADGSYTLGSGSFRWSTIYAQTINGLTTLTVSNSLTITGTGAFTRNSISQPIFYHGYVTTATLAIGKSNCSATFSASSGSTGNYTITHNIGNSNYTVQLTVLRASGTGAYIAKVTAIGTNSFDVIVFNDAGTSVDSDFMFMLIKN